MSNGVTIPIYLGMRKSWFYVSLKKIGAKSILPNLYAKYVLEMLSSLLSNKFSLGLRDCTIIWRRTLPDAC